MKDKAAEERLDRLARAAAENLRDWGSCAQATLLALQEEFGLGDAQTLKAATAMPGVALRGETCGAVIGSIMALGLAFGREEAADFEAVNRATGAARRFCRRFEAELGSCLCRDIQKRLFGRYFELTDAADVAEFAAAGAVEKCRVPVEAAVRIAGGILM